MKSKIVQKGSQRQIGTLKRNVLVAGGLGIALAIVFLIIFKLADIREVEAADTGGLSPSSAVDAGGSGASWSFPTRVFSSDNSRARSSIAKNNGISTYLEVTDFGFNVPQSALIDGISVSMERKGQSSNDLEDYDVYLTKDGTTNVGIDHSLAGYWPSSDATVTYGGVSDLWGASWDYSDINSSTFGFRIRVSNDDPNGRRRAEIDHITITVHYTEVDGTPGGVETDLTMWLKADGDVYENDLGNDAVEDNDEVKVWDDASDNGYDVASSGSYGTRPSFDENAMNYNPGVRFYDDGRSYLASSINNIDEDMSWFVVYKTRQTASGKNFWSSPAIIGCEKSGTNDDYGIGQSDGKPFFKSTSGNVTGAQASSSFNDGVPNLLTATRIKASSGSNYLYMNGAQAASYASDNVALSDPSTVGIGNGNDPYSSSQFGGQIAEVINYKGVLSEVNRHKVETYLAVKYGMTVDHDYVNSAGATVWDQATNSVYHNRVTAIMRDDYSSLDQRQSMSVHAGGVVAIGNADIAATNADNSNIFTANNSYLIFGDDDDDIFGTFETDYGTTTNAEVIDRRIARTWYLEEGGTVGTVELTFNLNQFPGVMANASTYDFTELRLLVDDDGVFATNALSVSPTSYVYNSTDTSITFHYDFASGGSYFSLATLDESGSPLPVEFSYFQATPNTDGAVELAWGTATETNNDYFEIERSQDGLLWESIATIDGGGTSIVGIDYLEYDYKPLYGVSFYRIRQVDFDGTTDYSIQRQIEFGAESLGVLEVKSVYPNPFSNFLSFDVSFPSEGGAELQLMNNNGTLLKQTAVQVQSGLNTLRMDGLDGLAAGYYILRVVKDGQQVSEQVLKR